MRRRAVDVEVTDHAVLRWLERAHGLDVGAIKQMLADKVWRGAELKACVVVLDGVRYVLREHEQHAPDRSARVVMTTVLKLDQRLGVGVDYARDDAKDRKTHGR